jgi:hypothetical protein
MIGWKAALVGLLLYFRFTYVMACEFNVTDANKEVQSCR